MFDMAKLVEWYKITQEMESLKTRELDLRNELFGAAFPDPVEGNKENKKSLPEGWILQGDYKINRTIDAAVLSELRKGDNTAPLVDSVIDYKPQLKLAAWKNLSAADRLLLSEMVTEKPGTPSLKIVLPKR